MGFMPTSSPPTPAPQGGHTRPVRRGDPHIAAALARLEKVMDLPDLSPGSLATVACSYANTALAAASLESERRWDPERLAAGRAALVGDLADVFGRLVAGDVGRQDELREAAESLREVEHPAAAIIADGVWEGFQRSLERGGGG